MERKLIKKRAYYEKRKNCPELKAQISAEKEANKRLRKEFPHLIRARDRLQYKNKRLRH
jgi:hypothetical protein